MADDVQIGVRAPGARQTAKDLQGVARAERDIGREATTSGAKITSGMSGIARAADKAVGSVRNLLTGFLGMRGALLIMRTLRAEVEAIDEASQRSARSMTGILALSTLGQARPEVQRQVQQMAIASGRKIEQVAPAYYTLLGGTAGMSNERRMGLMQQALLMARTDPTADLNSLVNLMSTMGTQQPNLSPQAIGNLASTTIELAKSTAGEMAAYLPDILTTGMAAGSNDPAFLAGMFSFATRRGGGVARSGTAVRAALLGLLSPGDEVAQAMGQYGFSDKMSIAQRVGWLARSGGNLPPEIIAALGGRRGIQAISQIAAQPQAFATDVSTIRSGLGAKGSLLQGRLQAMYGEMPGQAMIYAIDQLKAITDVQRTSDESLGIQAQVDLYKAIMRGQGASPARIAVSTARIWANRTFGLDPFLGTGITEAQQQYLGLLNQGYSAQQLVQNANVAGAFGSALETGLSIGSVPTFGLTGGQRDFRSLLGQRGVYPAINIGGTHFHGTYDDPAARPSGEVGE